MELLFNRTTIRNTLVNGLIKPNPANPDIPMWTVEDFDKPSPGTQYNIDCANNHPKSFPRGYQGIQHKNPLEDFRGMTLEQIDAKINPQFQPEEVQAGPDPKDFQTTPNETFITNDPNRPF